MRILALSDLRVQPLHVVRRLIESVAPDLVLYAGDDVGRFGLVPDDDYIDVAAEILASTGGRAPLAGVEHPACIAPGGSVLEWQARGAEGHSLERVGRDVYLGPWTLRGVPVVRAVPVARLGAGSPDEVYARCGPFGRRVGAPPVRAIRVGAEMWWAWVHRASAQASAGHWSSIVHLVPHGLAGVVGNDCHPLDAGVFKQFGCHDLGKAPLVVGGLAFIGLPGAPSDEEDAKPIGFVLYSKPEARDHLAAQLAQVGDRPCFLVSHTPPKGVLDHAVRFGPANIGSSVVRDALGDPRIRGVVCGHVHREGERSQVVGSCTVVNVASHDSEGSPVRYAVIEWTGGEPEVWLGSCFDHQELRRLDGIGDRRARALAAAGIDRISAVARCEPETLMAISGMGWIGDAERVVAHARAFEAGRPEPFATLGWIPAPVLMVDVETSDDNQDDPWLVGVGLPDGSSRQFQQLEAERHGEQLRALDAVAREHPDALFVSWSSFDRSALAKAARRLGEEPPSWLRERWLDLYHWVRKQVAFPEESLSLDAVASLGGFRRTSPLSGFDVGIMYRRYRAEGRAFDLDAVRLYNLEDVDALRSIYQALPGWLGPVPLEDLDERVVNVVAERGPLLTADVEDALGLPKKGGVVSAALARLRAQGAINRVGEGWDIG